MKNDLIVKEIFETQDLNNDQDMIQAINEEVKTSEAGIKKCIAASYKLSL